MKIPRGLRCVMGALILTFGVLALHYTFFGGVENHQSWAAKHGMAPPSFLIFLVGAAATVAGAFTVGHVVGSRARQGQVR